MNKNIINVLLVGSAAWGLASCSENTWNDHFLDGFEGGVNYESAVTGTYTLTADDYKAISDLMSAQATTDAEKAEAKAIATNCYFNKYGAFPASVALPPYLTTGSFPYYLASNGSQVDIAYAEVSEMPAELTALAGAETYTVSAADYAAAWGSETAFIRSYAPDSSPEANIPTALAAAYPDAAEGTYAVVTYNNATQNPMFGFPEETPAAADLYTASEFKAGKYLLYADGIVADIIDPTYADNKYSYFYTTEVTVSGETLSGFDVENNVFVFTETGTPGQYYLGDDLGHYYYGSERYNNFYINSSASDTDDYKWTVSKNDDGSWTVTNVLAQKWIQYAANYSSWGAYNYENGACPVLYVPNAEASTPVEIALYTPASTTENAVYYYNGSKWAVADGVSVLNPADYEAMGASNNKLSDPEIYLPIYLKNKLIYSQAGDQEYVVYNTNKADLFVFDGSSWTLNNNGFENVVGRFVKANNAWSFNKYIGKATFTYFNEDQLILDRSYLFVYGSICATPLDKSVSYGYLPVASVTISGQSIVMPSDANAFTFASSATVDGVEYKTPDGKFLIVDTTGRYNYYDGSHASMQLKATPDIVNGAISDAFLWTATHNEDGTWVFEAKYDESNIRWLVYSSSYNNFAIYSTITENDHNCSLYLMDE